MGYHYGSDSPEIDNPFKFEGLLYLMSGVLIFIIGILSLISIRQKIIDVGIAAGWLNLAISLTLITTAVAFLFKGFNKRSRFYVGRGAPTSLTRNRARGESHTVENEAYYQSRDIEQMLVGRKNPTFHEPVTLFDRIAYNFNRDFIFLPFTMRNYLHILIRNTGYSVIG